MPKRKWPHKLRRFAALDSAERGLLLRAVVWLAVARLWLVFVPFQRLASRLEPGANTTEVDAATLQRVGAAVKSAGRLVLFVDGEQVAQSSEFDPKRFVLDARLPLQIGFGQHDYFNGRMKDVRIYNRALSSQDIARLARDN